MDVDGHRAMLGYLERLNAAATAARMPAAARTQLLAQVRGRIERDAESAGGTAAAVDGVVRRLGAPDLLVRSSASGRSPAPTSVRSQASAPVAPFSGASRTAPMSPAPPAAPTVDLSGLNRRFRPGTGGRELAAVAVLGAGWILFPTLAPLVGGLLVLGSKGFRWLEKLVTIGALGLAAVLPTVVDVVGSRGSAAGIDLSDGLSNATTALDVTGFVLAVLLGFQVRPRN